MKDRLQHLPVSPAEREDIFEMGLTNFEWMRYRLSGQLPDEYVPIAQARLREQIRLPGKVGYEFPLATIENIDTFFARTTPSLNESIMLLSNPLEESDIMQATNAVQRVAHSLGHVRALEKDSRTAHMQEQARVIGSSAQERALTYVNSSSIQAALIKIAYYL